MPSHPRRFAVVVFVAALLQYAALPQRLYSGDDLQYLMVVDAAITGAVFYHPAGGRPFQPSAKAAAPDQNSPVNPRYPLEYPASVAAVAALRHLGAGDMLEALLWFRALVGAIGVALFFSAIQRLGHSMPIALLSAIGLATSASYWTYATHCDYSINTSAMLCAVMFLLVTLETSARARIAQVALPIALAMATLFTVTAALVALTTGIWLVRRRLRHDAANARPMAFALLFATALVAGLIWLTVHSWPAAVSADYWRRALYVGYPEYGVAWMYDTARSGIAIARAIVNAPGGSRSLSQVWMESTTAMRAYLIVFYGVATMLVAAPIAYLVTRRHDPAHGASLWPLWTTWLAAYSIANWIWDPGYVKFWVAPTVTWWGLFAIALMHARRSSRWYSVTLASASAAVIAVAVINLATQFRPESRPQSNPWRGLAERLQASPTTALFLSPAHPLDFHIAYFARRDVVATGLAAYGNGGNWTTVQRIVSAHVAAHRAAGGRVYVYGVESLPSAQREAFFRLLPAGVPHLVWRTPQLSMYELVR